MPRLSAKRGEPEIFPAEEILFIPFILSSPLGLGASETRSTAAPRTMGFRTSVAVQWREARDAVVPLLVPGGARIRAARPTCIDNRI